MNEIDETKIDVKCSTCGKEPGIACRAHYVRDLKVAREDIDRLNEIVHVAAEEVKKLNASIAAAKIAAASFRFDGESIDETIKRTMKALAEANARAGSTWTLVEIVLDNTSSYYDCEVYARRLKDEGPVELGINMIEALKAAQTVINDVYYQRGSTTGEIKRAHDLIVKVLGGADTESTGASS